MAGDCGGSSLTSLCDACQSELSEIEVVDVQHHPQCRKDPLRNIAREATSRAHPSIRSHEGEEDEGLEKL